VNFAEMAEDEIGNLWLKWDEAISGMKDTFEQLISGVQQAFPTISKIAGILHKVGMGLVRVQYSLIESIGKVFADPAGALGKGVQLPIEIMAVMSPPVPWKVGMANIKNDIASLSGQRITMDFSQPKAEIWNIWDALGSMAGPTGDWRHTIAGTARLFRAADLMQSHNRSIRGYASGTPYVPTDGLAYLHKGEAVIPKDKNNKGFGNININIMAGVKDPQGVARELKRELSLLQLRGV